MEGIDFTNLNAVLNWLAGAAGAAAWMIFLSNLVRNLVGGSFDPTTQPLPYKLAVWLGGMAALTRQLVVAIGSFIVPIGAKAILMVSLHQPLTVEGVWGFGAMLALCYLGQQQWFKNTKYD